MLHTRLYASGVGPSSGGLASSPTAAVPTLLDHEAELAQLRDLVARATAGVGSMLLIDAPAGIGKTALLQAAREMAERAGMPVLAARGRELEQEFVHGVTRQLLERVLAGARAGEREKLRDGAASLPWPLFDSRPGPSGNGGGAGPRGVDDRFSDACWHASAGNPLLLRDLIAELRSEHADPRAERVEAVCPDSVRRVVLARLTRLGGDARTLARAIAVLEKASLRQAATLAELSGEAARIASDRRSSRRLVHRQQPVRGVDHGRIVAVGARRRIGTPS